MNCPNCQGENVQPLKTGKILCQDCDTVFNIEKDGAKVEKTDVLSEHDKRISALEAKQPADKPVGPEGDEPEPQPAAQGPDQDETPDDNLYPA